MDSTGFFIGPSTIQPVYGCKENASGTPDISVDRQWDPHNLKDSGKADLDVGSTFQGSVAIMSDIQLPDHEIHSGGPDTEASLSDGYIALGTIRIVYREIQERDTSITKPFLIGNDRETPYPASVITSALKKGWIRIDDLTSEGQSGGPRMRLYVLPEDVDRGNRGPLRDFQKTIKWLLDFVDCTPEAWYGQGRAILRPQTYRQLINQQEESLFYIFNTLESPNPKLETTNASGYGYHVMSDILEDNIVGLKTPLYPYQRRSIAAMAQREADPAKICDARKRKFTDIHGQPFYLDPLEGVLLKDPPLYTEPQGGILAETMGYGKTLICIALILATRGHYPRVPQDRIDHFSYEPREKVGSLLAMAARRTKHEGLPWKTEFSTGKSNEFRFDSILNELNKYERAYAEPIFTPTTPGRKGKRDSYNTVRLCSATLIIVPTNLLLQWQQEIAKHVVDGLLEVLVIDTPTTIVPSWQGLLKYDIVLMSKARFEQEYRDDDLNQGKSRKGEARYRSPLTDVRWLRVVCDEGHGFAGSSCRTNAMAMLDKMYIERRWVVSGTPSSTLHGVEVNLSTTESSSETMAERDGVAEPTLPGRRQSISKALHKRRVPSAHEQEAKDLERLRLIVVNFLRLQPWANQRGSDNANWKQYLSSTVAVDGKRLSSPSLREVLQTLIIRHRIDDIDHDLQLPALHTKTVYLDPSYHDKLAINMFNLVLASNFVTSEREDEDYMFHPKNRRKFELLINNLRQATFHWVGFTEDHVKETLRISSDYLDKNIDKVTDEDGVMLTEAIMNGERALADPTWMAFSKLHEVGVYVKDFPPHTRAVWALDGCDRNPTLLGTVQAREAQKFIRDKVAKMSDDVEGGLAGAGIRAMKAAHDRAEDERKQSLKAKNTEGEKQTIGAIDEPKLKAPSASLTPKSVRQPQLSLEDPSPTTKRKWSANVKVKAGPFHSASLPSTPQSIVVGFTSAKLSYLANQLLLHSPSSKSIIFYSHPNTAFFIAEALELLHIKHRIYASTLSIAQRNAYLQLFNTDDSIRVLLMDLKQAGQGLHIASANRVYIVAPIWEDGVQSQAIKRAHRIGQTRDVYVETLVLKGTFEEDLIRRRQEIDQNPHDTTTYDAMDIDSKSDQASHPSTFSPHAAPTTGISANEADPDNNHNNHTKQTKLNNKTSRVTQKSKTQSLLDDRHMVQVLKDIKFLKFTSDEDANGDNVNARIAWMQTQPLLFSDDNTSASLSSLSQQQQQSSLSTVGTDTTTSANDGNNWTHDQRSMMPTTNSMVLSHDRHRHDLTRLFRQTKHQDHQHQQTEVSGSGSSGGNGGDGNVLTKRTKMSIVG